MKQILTIISLGLVIFAQGQNFSIDGEFRFRPEYRNGYKQLPDSNSEAAFFMAQRNRISFAYSQSKISSKLTIQEARTWGDELLKSDKSTLGIYEAWVSLQICDSLSLKLGRQELIFDNQRLFSNNNWSRTGQVHDAALLNFKSGKRQLDIALAFNQQAENTFGTDYDNSVSAVKDNYKMLSLIRYQQKFGRITLSLIAVGDGFQDLNSNAIYVRGTEGIGIRYKNDPWIGSVYGYFQNGHTQSGQEISAWYANAEFGYNAKKWAALIGMEVQSGDDVDSSSVEFNQFIPQYGSNHSFNGYMDYFTNMKTHTAGAGLYDTYLKLSYKLNDKHKVSLDYHYFALQQSVILGGNTEDPFLGNEFDFMWQVKFSKEIAMTIGYSLMLGSETLSFLRGGDENIPAHWEFVMLEIKPSFFTK